MLWARISTSKLNVINDIKFHLGDVINSDLFNVESQFNLSLHYI
jgi:hypothetical protein